ncbi:hypothetical protein D9758_000915 [Tetrapyrgos nigripes]|uniref:WD40 repeat-like protein n=1 Tax=Tetrapyrgos nigripes TaxID=182062 RepID=A0A8H5GZ99_9AGAR|nr:hypothetical protein D9758_000915 [Tetrapyrgos nigripes]
MSSSTASIKRQPKPKHLSFPAHGHSVITSLLLTLKPRPRVISASDDSSICVWSLLTGKLEKKLIGHEGGVWGLVVAPSGDRDGDGDGNEDIVVSGGIDRTVRVWDLNSEEEEEECKPKHVFGGHTSTVRCLAIVKPELVDVDVEVLDEHGDPTGHSTGVTRKERWPKRPLIVSGSRDHSLRVWMLPRRGEPEYRYQKTTIATGAETNADENDNPYHRFYLEGHDHVVRSLAARGRTLVSGSYDCTVRVWDVITGKCKWVLVGHTQKVYSVALDPSRSQIYSSSMDTTVRIWSTTNGTCLHTLTGHTSLVGLLRLSPSYLVSAAADATLRIWDPDTGRLLQTLAHTGAITCFQHDEFKVVSGGDGTLKMWDVRELKEKANALSASSTSDTGAGAAAAVGGGTMLRELLVGVTGVWQVAFEGRWCVTATNRKDATVLDVWGFGHSRSQKGTAEPDLDFEGGQEGDSEDERYLADEFWVHDDDFAE